MAKATHQIFYPGLNMKEDRPLKGLYVERGQFQQKHGVRNYYDIYNNTNDVVYRIASSKALDGIMEKCNLKKGEYVSVCLTERGDNKSQHLYSVKLYGKDKQPTKQITAQNSKAGVVYSVTSFNEPKPTKTQSTKPATLSTKDTDIKAGIKDNVRIETVIAGNAISTSKVLYHNTSKKYRVITSYGDETPFTTGFDTERDARIYRKAIHRLT